MPKKKRSKINDDNNDNGTNDKVKGDVEKEVID
jgi:hypothetical protein